MNFFVVFVCSTPSASSIASLEGFSTNLFPEKSQRNPTTMQDLSETTQHDTSDERHVTTGSCLFLQSGYIWPGGGVVLPYVAYMGMCC